MADSNLENYIKKSIKKITRLDSNCRSPYTSKATQSGVHDVCAAVETANMAASGGSSSKTNGLLPVAASQISTGPASRIGMY